MFPFKLRVARCCRHISSTLKTKLSAKENSLVLFWRTIKDTPRWSIGVFYTFAKLELFWLLVLVVCDSVITLGEIAYNVNIILREVFLAIVCTVHNTNILKTTSFFLKVVVSELCIQVRVIEKTSRIVFSRLVSYFCTLKEWYNHLFCSPLK